MTRTRREFTAATKRAAFDRSNAICECHRIVWMVPCGRPIGTGNVFYEHIICDGLNGDPTLENCAALSKTCWKIKTAEYDLPVIAKARRNHTNAINANAAPYRPLVGTKASGIALPFRGGPYDRRTGIALRAGSRLIQFHGGRR